MDTITLNVFDVLVTPPLPGERILAFHRFGVSECHFTRIRNMDYFMLLDAPETDVPNVTHWAPWPTKDMIKEG